MITFVIMDLMITEVQITCAILMILSLISINSIFSIHLKCGEIYRIARRFLSIGVGLIALHFVIQYSLHKHLDDLAHIRTLTNLFFGFPISFFINFSLVYLQKAGKLHRWEWSVIPFLYFIAIGVFVLLVPILRIENGVYVSSVIISFLYAIELLVCCYFQVTGYFHCLGLIAHEGNDYYIPLVRYTKWSVLIMTLLSLGFPLMTFTADLTLRSLYGILAISAGYFYIVSFVAFGFYLSSHASEAVLTPSSCEDLPLGKDQPIPPPSGSDELIDKELLTKRKLKQLNVAIDEFVSGDFYLQSGITFKDVAMKLDVPYTLFRRWLHESEYQKFNNWLVAIRLNRAEQLMLKYPNLTNEEVAQRCGFCDRQYFHTQFRKHRGMSPSKWLELHL